MSRTRRSGLPGAWPLSNGAGRRRAVWFSKRDRLERRAETGDAIGLSATAVLSALESSAFPRGGLPFSPFAAQRPDLTETARSSSAMSIFFMRKIASIARRAVSEP